MAMPRMVLDCHQGLEAAAEGIARTAGTEGTGVVALVGTGAVDEELASAEGPAAAMGAMLVAAA